jgi:cell shape-determining protein MreD
MCAYFWLVYRPDLFNLPVVFVLGMIADAASAVPFGAGLTAMLVMYLLVTNLIRYLNGRIFIVLWIIFNIFKLEKRL